MHTRKSLARAAASCNRIQLVEPNGAPAAQPRHFAEPHAPPNSNGLHKVRHKYRGRHSVALMDCSSFWDHL
jgi:hypothetical protein